MDLPINDNRLFTLHPADMQVILSQDDMDNYYMIENYTGPSVTDVLL